MECGCKFLRCCFKLISCRFDVSVDMIVTHICLHILCQGIEVNYIGFSLPWYVRDAFLNRLPVTNFCVWFHDQKITELKLKSSLWDIVN
jgi:hypothetical protein